MVHMKAQLLVSVKFIFEKLILSVIGKKLPLFDLQGLTTLNKLKSKEVSTNDGIITQNIFKAAVPTSSGTK